MPRKKEQTPPPAMPVLDGQIRRRDLYEGGNVLPWEREYLPANLPSSCYTMNHTTPERKP